MYTCAPIELVIRRLGAAIKLLTKNNHATDTIADEVFSSKYSNNSNNTQLQISNTQNINSVVIEVGAPFSGE